MKKATGVHSSRFDVKISIAEDACQKYGLPENMAGTILLYTQLYDFGIEPAGLGEGIRQAVNEVLRFEYEVEGR